LGANPATAATMAASARLLPILIFICFLPVRVSGL
jgi:hypothetical protein